MSMFLKAAKVGRILIIQGMTRSGYECRTILLTGDSAVDKKAVEGALSTIEYKLK